MSLQIFVMAQFLPCFGRFTYNCNVQFYDKNAIKDKQLYLSANNRTGENSVKVVGA